MDQFSHSRIELWHKCRFAWYLRYVDQLQTLPAFDADNALILGQAMHLGIQHDARTAVDWYYSQYPVITDSHVNEAIKLEWLIPRVKEVIPDGRYEVEISTSEFHGFIDLLTDSGDIYDFKYTKYITRYLDSPQLSLYRFYGQQQGRLLFVHIPKTMIRQRKTEDLYQFRKRLIGELRSAQVTLHEVSYDQDKVRQTAESAIDAYKSVLMWRAEIDKQSNLPTFDATAITYQYFPKNITKLCDWCEYQDYCLGGQEIMILPKNERRDIQINTTPDMWLYGDSYSGKTVFMDSFDNVLMLNTDGNIDHIGSPVIRIMDEVTQDGRITRRKLAWAVFLEAVAELEKRDNDFRTIVIDLVEDVFEHCRLFMYDKLGIEHEQDAGFGKGWDMVRTEFLSTMKRLKNCGYQLVFISKVLQKEITRKTGEKVTTFTPNVNERVSNVLAGMVDLTARIVADGDERYLSFKTSPYIFGGSRYNFGVDQIPLNRDQFIEILKKSQAGKKVKPVSASVPKPVEDPSSPSTDIPESALEPVAEEPKRARRARK